MENYHGKVFGLQIVGRWALIVGRRAMEVVEEFLKRKSV
jgi:hypothetical protein